MRKNEFKKKLVQASHQVPAKNTRIILAVKGKNKGCTSTLLLGYGTIEMITLRAVKASTHYYFRNYYYYYY